MRPEAQLSRAIRKVLELHGIHVYSTEAPRVKGPSGSSPGVSDLIVIDTDACRIAFVELKTGRGRLTEAQKTFRGRVILAGGEHRVWRSVSECVDWIDRGTELLGRAADEAGGRTPKPRGLAKPDPPPPPPS